MSVNGPTTFEEAFGNAVPNAVSQDSDLCSPQPSFDSQEEEEEFHYDPINDHAQNLGVGNDVASTMIVAMEDEILDTDNQMLYTDIMDDLGASAKQKLGSALFHLNLFLKRYSKQLGESYVRAQDLEIKILPDPDNPYEKDAVWFNRMVGCWFSYLGRDATKYGRVGCDLLSYQSATGAAMQVP